MYVVSRPTLGNAQQTILRAQRAAGGHMTLSGAPSAPATLLLIAGGAAAGYFAWTLYRNR